MGNIMETRREMSVRLQGQGVTGPALDLLLKMTAQARHMARVEQVLAKVAHLPRPVAALVLVADGVGVGGTRGLEGAATARLPLLQNLGKGRKHASDGGAWSAAIAHAATQLTQWSDGDGVIHMGRLVVGPTAVSLDYNTTDQDLGEFGWNDVIPAAWGIALSGNVITHMGADKALPEAMASLQLEGSLGDWAVVYNRYRRDQAAEQ